MFSCRMRLRPLHLLCALPFLLVALVGCGGGGGGTSSPNSSTISASYAYSTNAGSSVVLTIDPAGRFTIYAYDPTALPTGAAAQGNITTAGPLFAQSEDGTVQFVGQLASNGTGVSGTVRKNDTTVMSFSAVPITSATRGSASGASYRAVDQNNATLMSVDNTGIATVVAPGGGRLLGGQAAVGATGTLTSSDGSTAGQLTSSGSAYNLALTKLGGQTVTASIPLQVVVRAKWTFLVYMNASNNLQPYSVTNMNQMEQVGSTSDVNVVVQWKQSACGSCGSPQWTGTRRYLVTKDNDPNTVTSSVVETITPSVDMGDWHSLRSFVAWGKSRFPADHYAVLLWDHGSGWDPYRSAKPTSRAISIDSATNNAIEVWELPEALADSNKLDILAYDACVMQMTEVAYELKDTAKVMVGSEENVPQQGYFYNAFLADLVANPNMTAQQLGTSMVNRTLEAYTAAYGSQYITDTIQQSAIDLTKMDSLKTALDTFATSLDTHRTTDTAAISSARLQTMTYEQTTPTWGTKRDLAGYAKAVNTLASSADLKLAAQGMISAVNSCVLAETHGTSENGSYGLSIYLPTAGMSVDSSYSALALSRTSKWITYLRDTQ